MATDPVKKVEQHVYPSVLTMDLNDQLQRLAALAPSTDAPYLTISADWRPYADVTPHRRMGRVLIYEESKKFLAQYQPHTPAYDSVIADLKRVLAYLEAPPPPAKVLDHMVEGRQPGSTAHEQVPAETQGVFIVACHAQNVYETLLLPLPVRTRIVAGSTPALWDLVRMADDFRPYALLIASQNEAKLRLISRGQIQQMTEVEGQKWPVHQKQGGWADRRFQTRADERIDAFAKRVAEETRHFLGQHLVEQLIVASDTVIGSPLEHAFHPTVKEHLIGWIRLPIEATTPEILAKAEPLIVQAERQREHAAADNVRDQVGSNASGVAGATDTLTALETGQVQALVMNDDFRQAGWADYTLPLFGVGAPPTVHPAGGDVANIVPVALEEEMLRLAIHSSADLNIITTRVPIVSAQDQTSIPDGGQALPRTDAARTMDALGGVGAVVRFPLKDLTIPVM